MHVRDRRQKTVRKGQNHKDNRTSVKITMTGMRDSVEFCARCMAMWDYYLLINPLVKPFLANARTSGSLSEVIH